MESATGGYLALGKLTAKVEKKERVESQERRELPSIGNPDSRLSTLDSGLFSIRTPTAIVTDLGTEFGVEVGSEGAVEAQVFGGQIEFQPSAPSGRLSKKLRLREKSKRSSAIGQNRHDHIPYNGQPGAVYVGVGLFTPCPHPVHQHPLFRNCRASTAPSR